MDFWTGFFWHKNDKKGYFQGMFFNNFKRNFKKKFSWDTLGKHHHKNIAVHLGIAQIAIGPPPPHSNGHSVAPIFGQHHANARLYMVISSKNRCHKPSWQAFWPPQNQANACLYLDNSPPNRCQKPSWQGFRPPPPNGQCPNELLYFLSGASLNRWNLIWFKLIWFMLIWFKENTDHGYNDEQWKTFLPFN